jgi:type IV pilus assembly protein PilA
MIVIAIIAIIVMLAIPAYQDYAIRAKVGESLSVAAAAKTSVTEACQSNPLMDPSNNASGYSFTPTEYVASVDIGGTCAEPTVQMTTQGTGATPDPVLVLTGNFSVGAGRYDWTCKRNTGSNKLVPARCRST